MEKRVYENGNGKKRENVNVGEFRERKNEIAREG